MEQRSRFRAGTVERRAEYIARQHLASQFEDVDRKVREPALLPLAWSWKRRVIPGFYRVWLGFEYDFGSLSASAMAFRLELLDRSFFAGTTPRGGEQWRPNKVHPSGETLSLVAIESAPFHAHTIHLKSGWRFEDSALSFPRLWQTMESPLIGKPEFAGEVVIEWGMHPDYRRILVRESGGSSELVSEVIPFTTVAEYRKAWERARIVAKRPRPE